MNKVQILIFILFNCMLRGQNIIPNGNMSLCGPLPNSGCSNCQYGAGVNSLNANLTKWRVADHDIGKGNYEPKVVDFSNATCQNLPGYSYCNIFQPDPNASPSAIKKRFIRLRADYDKKCKANKKWHDAVGVQLENGGVFDQGVSFIIRYKINPIRSTILDPNSSNDDNVNTCNTGTGDPFFSHVRFFLSEKSPDFWNYNNSDKQEIYNVNFTKQIPDGGNGSTNCNWYQVERKFTPNQNNYTTLIIYQENGGAFISDIQVFEECINNLYVQNKYYDNFVFGPNAIDGYNWGEKAGSNLFVGKSVDTQSSSGDVILDNGSKVNFTASSLISIDDGFSVNPGSDFTAEILPCPNNLNRMNNSPNINPDPNYVILPPLLNDQELEKIKQYDNDEIDLEDLTFKTKIYPNPNNGNFKFILNTNSELPTTIKIVDSRGNEVKTILNPIEYEYEFSLNSLAKGLYIINAFYREKTVSKRFIKN